MQSLSLDTVPETLRGCTVAIGNFDGVHKGHAWVLQVARGFGLPVVVLTFEPHPRTVLLPHSAPFRLTLGAEKIEALAKAGADAAVTLNFDKVLAETSALSFVERILVDGLSAGHVVVGHDYRFGREQEGDAAMLSDLGRRRGFRLTTASPARNSWGERFSSSRIRDHILAGELVDAARLLGRPWTLRGEAEAGCDGLFRLPLGAHLRPAPGRYAVTLRGKGARPIPGEALLAEGADTLVLIGAEAEGDTAVSLHQRLNAAPRRQEIPSASPGESAHIFYAAE